MGYNAPVASAASGSSSSSTRVMTVFLALVAAVAIVGIGGHVSSTSSKLQVPSLSTTAKGFFWGSAIETTAAPVAESADEDAATVVHNPNRTVATPEILECALATSCI